jgi:hypothetical protein
MPCPVGPFGCIGSSENAIFPLLRVVAARLVATGLRRTAQFSLSVPIHVFAIIGSGRDR